MRSYWKLITLSKDEFEFESIENLKWIVDGIGKEDESKIKWSLLSQFISFEPYFFKYSLEETNSKLRNKMKSRYGQSIFIIFKYIIKL